MRAILGEPMFVGNFADARDLRLLYEHEIRAVVDVALNETPAQLGRETMYLRFPLVDGGGNSQGDLRVAILTVVSLLEARIPTLIACSAGMSRSPSVAAIAVAIHRRLSPDEVLREITSHSPHDVSPLFWNEAKRAVADRITTISNG